MWKPFTRADVIVEALDNAETKIQFIEENLNHFPDKYIVAASGVAGYGHSDRIKTIHNGNLFIVYDELALSSNDDVLLAPKVCLMANWQANIVLEILLGDIK
jgi:sulfur carrier protein ThiS adenylyltransferase